MQSRILQVTHLGNFQRWLAPHIVGGRPQGRPKTKVVSDLSVNCTIARLRGSSQQDDNDSVLVAGHLGNT